MSEVLGDDGVSSICFMETSSVALVKEISVVPGSVAAMDLAMPQWGRMKM